MVGNGNSRHTISNGFIYKLGDTRLSVKYRILCMYV